MIQWVTIRRFCEISGYTESFVRTRIIQGFMKEGRDWLISPRGDVLFRTTEDGTGLRGRVDGYQAKFLTFGKISKLSGFVTLPHGPGIYLLLQASDRSVVYVGQSQNMRQRLGQHLMSSPYEFDAVRWIQCEPEELSRIERAYINIYQPKYNKAGR